jgi:hypothetical protein
MATSQKRKALFTPRQRDLILLAFKTTSEDGSIYGEINTDAGIRRINREVNEIEQIVKENTG